MNQCRLYLQVLRLSDITEGYRDQFSTAYRVERDSDRKSKYSWPRIERPGTSAIKLWKSALRKTFGLKEGLLEYNVGDWNYSPVEPWNWFYHPNSQLIYQRFGHLWRVWRRSRRTRRTTRVYQIQYITNALSLPPDTVRATVTRQSYTKAKFTGWAPHQNQREEEYSSTIAPTQLPIENEAIQGD